MGWVNHIKFKVNFGKGKNVKKSYELRSVFKKILVDKTYSVRDSSITIEDNKIILNLSLRIPKNIIELDNNTVVGVDLGIAIPAVCATNNTIAKQYLGSKDDFLKTRTQIQNQRRRLYSALKNSNGGKGRDKKLKAVNKFSEKEKNFVATYNHTISKQIVDFAIANKAKYINVEDLEGYDTDKFVLRNWSYYQLQSQIEYKAAKYGIELRKVDPYHTSQNCSSCGHWEEGQRNGRYFECKACGAKMNADLNAARNIALSANITYVDGKKIETNTTDVPKKKLIRKSLRQ
jgi:IS605 OrfB family transposase